MRLLPISILLILFFSTLVLGQALCSNDIEQEVLYSGEVTERNFSNVFGPYKDGKEVIIHGVGKSTYTANGKSNVGYIDPNLLALYIKSSSFSNYSFRYAFARNKNDIFNTNTFEGLIGGGESIYGFINVDNNTSQCLIKIPLKTNILYLDDIITQHAGGEDYGAIPYCSRSIVAGKATFQYSVSTFYSEVMSNIRTDPINAFSPDPILTLQIFGIEIYNSDTNGDIDTTSRADGPMGVGLETQIFYVRIKSLGRAGTPNTSTDPSGTVFEDVKIFSSRNTLAPGNRTFFLANIFSCSDKFDLTQKEFRFNSQENFRYFNLSNDLITNPSNYKTTNLSETIKVEKRGGRPPRGCDINYNLNISAIGFEYDIPPSGDSYCQSSNTLLSRYDAIIDRGGSHAIVYYEGDPKNGGKFIESIKDISKTGNISIYAEVSDAIFCSKIITFNIVVNPISQFSNTNFSFCLGNTYALRDLDSRIITQNTNNFDIEYYTSETDAEAGNITVAENKNTIESANTPITQSLWIRVENKTTNCIAVGSIKIIIPSNPTISPTTSITQCDDTAKDGFTTFNLNSYAQQLNPLIGTNSNLSVKFYKNNPNTNSNEPELGNTYTNTTASRTSIFAIVEDQQGCKSDVGVLTLNIDSKDLYNPNYTIKYVSCDETDGTPQNKIGVFDFSNALQKLPATVVANNYNFNYYETKQDGLSKQNKINPKNYQNNATPQSIYLGITNKSDNCEYLYPTLKLEVKTNPIINVEVAEGNNSRICIDNPKDIELKANLDNINVADYSFEWNSGQKTANAIVNMPGTYSMNYTDIVYKCPSSTNSIEIKGSEKPSIKTITQLNSIDAIDNKMKIVMNNNPQYLDYYEYAIKNKTTFQKSPFFENVEAGIQTVIVKDNLCGTTERLVRILNYPRFFTPNNDDINEYWSLEAFKGLKFEASIYDRYGTLITKLNNQLSRWDGTYEGADLPEDDYWFEINYQDPHDNQNRMIVASFSLKR